MNKGKPLGKGSFMNKPDIKIDSIEDIKKLASAEQKYNSCSISKTPIEGLKMLWKCRYASNVYDYGDE